MRIVLFFRRRVFVTGGRKYSVFISRSVIDLWAVLLVSYPIYHGYRTFMVSPRRFSLTRGCDVMDRIAATWKFEGCAAEREMDVRRNYYLIVTTCGVAAGERFFLRSPLFPLIKTIWYRDNETKRRKHAKLFATRTGGGDDLKLFFKTQTQKKSRLRTVRTRHYIIYNNMLCYYILKAYTAGKAARVPTPWEQRIQCLFWYIITMYRYTFYSLLNNIVLCVWEKICRWMTAAATTTETEQIIYNKNGKRKKSLTHRRRNLPNGYGQVHRRSNIGTYRIRY